MEDARRHPRTRIDFPVNVVNYGAGSRDDGRIIVLGQGGASLELSGNYSVGSMLRLGFELPATKGEITCTAIVRGRTLPAKIDETLRPLVISVEGGEVSGR